MLTFLPADGIAFNSNELTGSIPDTISQLSNLGTNILHERSLAYFVHVVPTFVF
jgi:hypothetical protein